MTAEMFTTADIGPAPEPEIVRDLLRKALPVGAACVAFGAIGWGGDGAVSAAVAVGLVCLNFVIAASSLAWAARVNYGLLMGVALFGFLVRIAVIGGAVMGLDAAFGWVEPTPLGLVLVVTHLGLLFWELRYVSASLASPALRPRKKEQPHR
jgi:hypothetical protein